MRVHCDAIMHCGPWHCLASSFCVFPASSLLFSQKYQQNYKAFKIQNLSRTKKEYRPKEQSNFMYSSTCKNNKINRLGILRICFFEFELVIIGLCSSRPVDQWPCRRLQRRAAACLIPTSRSGLKLY
jgi:hypothetical protein